MRHLADLKDLTPDEIIDILDRADRIKANKAEYGDLLRGKSMAMLFQKTSTRTRVSFEVAMTELGGHAIYVDWQSSNFVLSGIDHETEYLSRNVSCIMARLLHNADLRKVMAASKVPVINGCCEKFHPCQALTDLMTIREHHAGDIQDVTLAFVGVQNNVANSLSIICDKLGVNLILATPPDESNGENLDAEVEQIIASSSTIQRTSDAKEAVRAADFVYTDTWVDMQFFNDPAYQAENDAKMARMMPFQINRELLTGINCRIMHDMPIHDGFEITAEMVRDPRAIIYDQAANRLHAQKGLLWWLYDAADLLG